MQPALREIAKLIEKARPGNARDLVHIHIGKCGGSTVNAAIRNRLAARPRVSSPPARDFAALEWLADFAGLDEQHRARLLDRGA